MRSAWQRDDTKYPFSPRCPTIQQGSFHQHIAGIGFYAKPLMGWRWSAFGATPARIKASGGVFLPIPLSVLWHLSWVQARLVSLISSSSSRRRFLTPLRFACSPGESVVLIYSWFPIYGPRLLCNWGRCAIDC